ncbi:aminotransferase DegT [Natronococcus pandeyae]|uniref:Aminotransferase DegT n=1 Tax=Natronococcus pandeyae TaxID=2055836 RepID=A0A8J8Q877_9EURY|nr:DegT/DnrJ/EryC1/StrS family aminotransferase [Natronococcus pandeyae]TYL38940.1 aminotransferase DegT [Natronococcus pandeyae]
MVTFYRPATGTAEATAVADALETGTLSTGEIVEQFESEFASFCGRDEGVAVASGSIALEFALSGAPLERDDGIVVSPFNCSAVLYSVLRSELTPVFADIDPETLALDPAAVERVLDERDDVTALLLTPSYGLPASFDPLQSLADDHDLVVVNDFCQAPGATYDGDPVGSYGDVAICSFGATKNITTGEGGMLVGDDHYAEYASERRSNDAVDSTRQPLSARMSDVAASIGRVQLERYPDLLEQRRAVAAAYRETLPEIVTPQPVPDRVTHAYHRFPVRTPDREALTAFLERRGIPYSIEVETPLYDYDAAPGTTDALPGTEAAIDETVLLPMHPGLTPATAAAISESIASFAGDG